MYNMRMYHEADSDDLYLLDGPHPTYSVRNKRGDLGKKADFTFSLNTASRTRRSGLKLLDPKLPGCNFRKKKSNSAQREILRGLSHALTRVGHVRSTGYKFRSDASLRFLVRKRRYVPYECRAHIMSCANAMGRGCGE
jgi:hypothetical protein